MNPNPPCPLGDEHCAALDKAQAIAAQMRALAEQCIDCGVDLSDVLEQIKAKELLAQKLKSKFFPNRV